MLTLQMRQIAGLFKHQGLIMEVQPTDNDFRFGRSSLGLDCGGELPSKDLEIDQGWLRAPASLTTNALAHYQMEATGIAMTESTGGIQELSTTVMDDKGVVKQTALSEAIPRDPTLVPMSTDINNSIAEFLRKPVRIGTGGLTTAFANIYTDLFEPLFTIPAWKAKLDGIYAIRANPVVTIKINANRTTYGLYGLSFLPTGGSAGGHGVKMQIARGHSKCQRSQLLTVYADVNCDSSVQLKCPWVNAFPYYLVNRNGAQQYKGSTGRFVFWEYEEVKSLDGAVGGATYAIYIHYEDVVVLGAVIPQSGFNLAHYQAGVPSRKSRRGEKDLVTQEIESTGVISGGLALAATMANALSSVPVLTAAMTPISWLLEASSKAASYMGFSAPVVATAPHKVVHDSVAYLTNFDKHAAAQPLSLSVRRHVPLEPSLAGTTDDEMSIDYLKGRFAYLVRYQWSNAETANTLLFTLKLAPREWYSNTVEGVITYYNPTPVNFLTRLARYWRGSLLVKLRFVKTEFHLGRLRVVFDPLNSNTAGAVNNSSEAMAYRRTIDIRGGNEVTLRIPFISDIDWRTTDPTIPSQSLGNLYFYVEDPLTVSAAAAATTIGIIVEVAGGGDFAVAGRRFPDYVTVTPVAQVQSGLAHFQSGLSEVGAVATSGRDPHCLDAVTDFAPVSGTSANENAAASCMGESIVSLAQLLKSGGTINSAWVSIGASGAADVHPFHWQYNSSDGAVVTTGGTNDPFSIMSAIFCLVRGGVRLAFVTPQNDSSGQLLATVSYGTTVLPIINTGVASYLFAPGAPFHFVDKAHGKMYVDVPFYHLLPASVTDDLGWYTGAGLFGHTQGAIDIRLNVTNVNAVGDGLAWPLIVHRAGADDCRFHGFIAIPPSAIA